MNLGPLEILFSWPSVIAAAAVVGIMATLTTVGSLTIPASFRQTKWYRKVILPVVTVLVGALYALVVPLRPEVLLEYAAEHLSGAWVYLGYMGWGAACGQFSQTIYDRLKDLLRKE